MGKSDAGADHCGMPDCKDPLGGLLDPDTLEKNLTKEVRATLGKSWKAEVVGFGVDADVGKKGEVTGGTIHTKALYSNEGRPVATLAIDLGMTEGKKKVAALSVGAKLEPVKGANKKDLKKLAPSGQASGNLRIESTEKGMVKVSGTLAETKR